MTIVLTILVGVGLALLVSCLVALAASAIVGGAMAVFSGGYAGVRAAVRHSRVHAAKELASDRVPTEVVAVEAPAPLVTVVRPAPVAVPRWSWLRPVATVFLIFGVTLLLEGPDSTWRRRGLSRR